MGRSSPPNVKKKKNKVSLCSACFNNFHKFSSEIKKNGRREGKERRQGTDRDLGGEGGKSPRETAPLRCQVWTETHRLSRFAEGGVRTEGVKVL